MMQPVNDAININDVMRLANCSRDTVYRWMSTRGFPNPEGYLGREKLWRRTAVVRWLEAQ